MGSRWGLVALILLFSIVIGSFQNCSSQTGAEFFAANSNGDPYEGIEPTPDPGPNPGPDPGPLPIPGVDFPLEKIYLPLEPADIPELQAPQPPAADIRCVLPPESGQGNTPSYFSHVDFNYGSSQDFFRVYSDNLVGVYQWQSETLWVNYQFNNYVSTGVYVESMEFNQQTMSLVVNSIVYYLDQGLTGGVTFVDPSTLNWTRQVRTETLTCAPFTPGIETVTQGPASQTILSSSAPIQVSVSPETYQDLEASGETPFVSRLGCIPQSTTSTTGVMIFDRLEFIRGNNTNYFSIVANSRGVSTKYIERSADPNVEYLIVDYPLDYFPEGILPERLIYDDQSSTLQLVMTQHWLDLRGQSVGGQILQGATGCGGSCFEFEPPGTPGATTEVATETFNCAP